MALQFQPPEWLIKEYMDRKSPAEEIGSAANSAVQMYLQQKQLKQQQAFSQEDRDIKLAQLSSEGGTNGIDTLNAIRRGRGATPITLPAQPGQAAPSMSAQTAPQTQEPDANFTSATGEDQNVTPSGSPILSHLRSIGHPMGQLPGEMAQAPTKPAAPAMGSDPGIQEFLQMGSPAYQAKYGPKGMAKVKVALDIEKGLQERNKPSETPKTLDAVLAGRVSRGEMTLDDAISKQAEAAGLKTTGVDTARNNVKISAEKPKAKSSLDDTQKQYDALIAEATAIRNDPALASATGMLTPLAHINGTGARRVAARIETLKSKTLLNTLGSLKSLSSNGSSGFGALSEKEGAALQSAVTALDRGMSTDDFKASIDRIIQDAQFHKQNMSKAYEDTYQEPYQPGTTLSSVSGGETKVINGQTFVKQNGQWYHQ